MRVVLVFVYILITYFICNRIINEYIYKLISKRKMTNNDGRMSLALTFFCYFCIVIITIT